MYISLAFDEYWLDMYLVTNYSTENAMQVVGGFIYHYKDLVI